MARRRSKPQKIRKLGTDDLTRQLYMSRGTSGLMDAERWGFRSSKNGKVDTCVFFSRYAAKIYLDLMIGDDEVSWDDDAIITSRDVLIEANVLTDLREIYEHRLTYEEKRYFVLNDEYHARVTKIRSDSFAKPFVEGETHRHKVRTSRKGMILMKDIARELGMTPRVARGILRELMDKPDHGWAWRTEAEIGRIRALLQGKPLTVVRVDLSGVKRAQTNS